MNKLKFGQNVQKSAINCNWLLQIAIAIAIASAKLSAINCNSIAPNCKNPSNQLDA